MIAMIIPISTNTMIAPCNQIHVGDIVRAYTGSNEIAVARRVRDERAG